MNKLVTLASYSDPTEAYIIKGLLESEGIQAFIFDERAAVYTPLTVSGIRLVVKLSDLENAINIIKLSEEKEQE